MNADEYEKFQYLGSVTRDVGTAPVGSSIGSMGRVASSLYGCTGCGLVIVEWGRHVHRCPGTATPTEETGE